MYTYADMYYQYADILQVLPVRCYGHSILRYVSQSLFQVADSSTVVFFALYQ